MNQTQTESGYDQLEALVLLVHQVAEANRFDFKDDMAIAARKVALSGFSDQQKKKAIRILEEFAQMDILRQMADTLAVIPSMEGAVAALRWEEKFRLASGKKEFDSLSRAMEIDLLNMQIVRFTTAMERE
jgi:hypothetical protein